MPGEFRPPESLEEKLARLRSTYSEQQARHNPFYDAAPAADDMDEEDVPFAPTPRDTYWDWDIGIPAPFDLSRGERKLFNDAVSSFVVRAGTVFSQHGAEMQTPSGSEAGYRGARASWGQTQTPLGGQAAPWAKLGVWGHRSQPEPHPTLMGNIITPVLEMQRDESGFQTNVVRPENFIAAALERGRGIAQEQIYGNRAKGIAPMYQEGMPTEDFESMVRAANRTGMAAVRSSVGMFATSVWAERYAWPYGQREAMRNAVQLQNMGEYGLNPRDVFGALAPSGYFTRKAFASRDKYNPERSTWAAYHVSSLAAGGWLYDPNQRPEEHGVFTTDVELGKIPKRRQLFVQDIAVTHGERNQRRGRWTGDRGSYGNALLLANYPLSEGTAVISPDAAPRGFWKHTTQFVERPSGAANWEVLWNKRKLTEPGAPLVFGTQMVDGREQPFLPIEGREGVRQSLWNVKYINEPNREGYELSIGQLYPSKSGSFKMMHNGMKALMMKSASTIAAFRSSSGIQNIDVVGPLPKSFSLLQHGMIDLLPKKVLMPMLQEGGLSEEEATRYIRGRNREPLYDALTKAMRSDKYRVDFTHEINVGSRELEAFKAAGILAGDPRRLEGNRFMAPIRMVGYNIPIPLQYRQEYPGRKPFYSGEVLKALATKMGGVEAEFAGQARVELARLTRGNPFANILGAALATAGGGRPKRSIGYNEVPWLSISGAAEEMGLPGNEGLLQALQDSMKQSNAKYIVGPEGLVLPSPRDVLRMGERNLQGKQLSRFVTSYGRAISALRDQPENLQEVMAEFRGELSTMAGHSNVRRHALGTALKNAVEGPYVGHVGIPDEYIVGGDDALMKFGGLSSREDLASFKERISAEPFLVAGTRNPIVDKERQLETVMRLVTPEMAKKMWDVDIEDLGRNVATSTFFAVTQRGDFDADRAIFRALTRKLFGSGEMFTPDFYTLDYNGQRRNMLRALQAQSPQAFEDYLGRVPPAERALVEAGMAGRRRGTGAAMARATYGIRGGDAGWNEAAKWAESLEAPATMKGPMLVSEMYRYTGAQVIDAFRTNHVEPKSNMGVIYNQFIRALPALARGVKEEAAANALGAVAYQSTVDMQKLERSLGVLLDLTYFQGAGGTMHRRYSDAINRQDEWYPVGGPAGTLGVLMKQIRGLPISTEMQAALFSRDPRIQSLFKQGNLDAISTALRGKEREFLSDPMQAGPLIELVRSQQFAKQSWATVSKTPAEARQMATGEGVRAYRQMFSKSQLTPESVLEAFRTAVDKPGEMEFTQGIFSRRTGISFDYVRSTADFLKSLIPSFANPALPGKEFLAYISTKEADVLEGLRQMPGNQARQIAAHVSKPARGTSFETGPGGWDKDASFYAYLERDKDFINSLRTLPAQERNRMLNERFQAWKGQNASARTSAFTGASPTEVGGTAGRRLERERQEELLQRQYISAATPEEQVEVFRQAFRHGESVNIPSGRSEYSQLAWQAASEMLTSPEAHSLEMKSYNRGATTRVRAIKNQDTWRVHGAAEIIRGFEDAARRTTDSDTGYRVHSASEGQVYGQWKTLANRPTESRLAQMSASSQLSARAGIVEGIMDTVGARKLNLGDAWQAQMPQTAAVYEQNVKAIEGLRKGMGDLTDAMKASRESVTKNTEVQAKLTETFKLGSAGYDQARQIVVAAQQQQQAGISLSPEMQGKLATARGVFAYGGSQGLFKMASDLLASEEATALESDAMRTMAGGSGGRRGGFAGLANKLFGGQQGAEKGAAGALFDDVAFGWTAFRLRMVMGLTTGAQRGWRDQFYGEQSSVANAALMLGATPGTSGALGQYLTGQNRIANMRANLGYGSAQVTGGFAGMLANTGAGAGVGSAATIAGYAAAATMGTGVVANALTPLSATIGAAATPLAIGAGLAVGTTLGVSYVAGQAPEFTQYDKGTWSRAWRESARRSELYAESKGLPGWMGVANQLLSPTAAFTSIGISQSDEVNKGIAAEEAQWNQPNYLPRVMTQLKDMAATRWSSADTGQASDLTARIAQLTGISGDALLGGRGEGTLSIADKLMDYVVAGADVGSVYGSMVSATGAAGVPLGKPAENWMNQYLDRVPAEKRPMYEQYLGALGGYRQATGRPLDIGLVPRTQAIAEQYGYTPEQAANIESARRGYGAAQQQYGALGGSLWAIDLGWRSTKTQTPEEQAQQTAWRGMLAPSIRGGGADYINTEIIIDSLRKKYPNRLTEVQELVVQARNVVLQTDRGTIGGIIAQAESAGAIWMSPERRSSYVLRSGGLAGLAPSTMLQGSTQAAAFEQSLPLSGELSLYQSAAAQILQQTLPAGYAQQQLLNTTTYLQSGASPQAISTAQSAYAGRLGIGTSTGYGIGSFASQGIDTSALRGISTLPGYPQSELVRMMPGATDAERAAFLGSFLPGSDRLTSSQIGQLINPGYSIDGKVIDQPGAAYTSALNVAQGVWSPAAGRANVEISSRATPWGYSMALAADAGLSIEQLLAGQTAPGALQDIYGREAGYAGLFAAQQASGWANYRLSAASIPIQRAQWERQQATTRMEYGGGALQPLQNVMLALSRPRDEQGNLAPTINPTGLPGGEIGVSGEVGVGLNVGGSAIGLVQQEAGIRRQMWQENLNAQRASIGFQQQQLQIAREQLQLSKQEYAVRREYQITEREAGRSQSLLQRSWATQDFNIGQQRMGIQQQWAQEDVDRAIRYSSGRERQQLLRQRDRMQVTQGWERDDSQRNRKRQEELWRREDERYSNAVKYEEQLNVIQMQKFALQEKSLALQEAQLAAQAAHVENIAKLQTDLQKIEDDRFKNQYENIQAQLKEEEILQPLREDAQRAELAYMALRLQHAQKMHDAEIAFWKAASGFIEAMYAAMNGKNNVPPPAGGAGVPNPAGVPPEGSHSYEQPVMSGSGSDQPVVVEIMMDTQKVGEILLTPERLRRGTKVLLEREKWR